MIKNRKIRQKKSLRKRYTWGPVAVLIFAGMSYSLLTQSNAAPNGLTAAASPRYALGVSGTSSTTFARWLDRDNINEDIKFGETNAHFSHSSIESKIQTAATSPTQRTLVVTISATPENNTNFIPDRSLDPALCGTYGSTTDATQSDFQDKGGSYNVDGVNVSYARANLKAAKHDQNANGIRDNIEHLHRAVNGCYDNVYEHVADMIVQYQAYEYWPDGRPKLIIRFGHEHDGDFYEWSSTNQTADDVAAAMQLTGGKNGNQLYKELWQRAVGIVNNRVSQSVPGAKVHWEFNIRYKGASGGSLALLNATYPGDQYVDVVGIDFYDRLYSLPDEECYEVVPGEQEVPNCRTQQEKESAWQQTEIMLDAISDFAASRNKLIGVSEQAISTAVITRSGTDYWEHGGDNAYYIEKSYEWVEEQTTDLGRLAYYVIFDRNGEQASKELGSDLGADGLKSIHKMLPGATNAYRMPAADANTTCALQWDFVPLDEDGNEVSGAAPQTHLSRFPNASRRFLELWSGPIDGGPPDHPNCQGLTFEVDRIELEAEGSGLNGVNIESSNDASGQSYIEFTQ